MVLPLKILIVATLAAGAAVAVWYVTARHDGGGIEGRWRITTLPEGWKPVPGAQVIVTASDIRICIGEVPAATLHYTLDVEKGTIDAVRKFNGEEETRLAVYRRSRRYPSINAAAAGKPRPSGPEVAEGTERWVLERKGD